MPLIFPVTISATSMIDVPTNTYNRMLGAIAIKLNRKWHQVNEVTPKAKFIMLNGMIGQRRSRKTNTMP